jgi:hypothetical protein
MNSGWWDCFQSRYIYIFSYTSIIYVFISKRSILFYPGKEGCKILRNVCIFLLGYMALYSTTLSSSFYTRLSWMGRLGPNEHVHFV